MNQIPFFLGKRSVPDGEPVEGYLAIVWTIVVVSSNQNVATSVCSNHISGSSDCILWIQGIVDEDLKPRVSYVDHLEYLTEIN